MKSWRTNIAGITTLAGIAMAHFYPEHQDLINKLMAAAVAYGLMNARDNRVTSESANEGK